jgi:hypothetical protein
VIQERNQPVGERMPVRKDTSTEKRKLEDDAAKLQTKDIHRFQELRNFGVAVHEHLVVHDGLRNFDRKP